MRAFSPRSRDYDRFETQFVKLIHEYWLDHQDKFLADAAALLARHDQHADQTHLISPIRRVAINGWLTPNQGFKLRLNHLRALNPEYTIHLKRYIRREISRRDQIIGAGFHINARSATTAPLFNFHITNARGESHRLPSSNSDAEYQLDFYPPLGENKDSGEGPRAHGYLDSIRQELWPIDDNRSTWLGALAHRFPSEMLVLIDSPQGKPWAALVAHLLGAFSTEARWADKFNLAGLGLAGTYRSDFALVTVTRPEVPTSDSAMDSIALPVFVNSKGVLKAQAGTRILSKPSTEWLELHDAAVQDGGTVLAGSSLIIYEESSDPKRDFVAGQWETIFGSQMHPEAALIRPRHQAAEVIDEGILLAGRSDSNWYHWLIEYLPRVMLIDDSMPAQVPLLITPRTPASGIDALRAVTDRPIRLINPDELQLVRKLHVVAPPVQILDSTRIPWAEGLRFNPAPLRSLREAWGLHDRPVKTERRIFLSRKSAHRGLLNEAELEQIAKEMGLEIVEPGGLSFAEQLELFATASLVVGASGAVMANYLMMSRGARIIALTSDALTDFILPPAIAGVMDLDFSYISGPTSTPLAASGTRNNWIHSDFTIDARLFTQAVKEAQIG